MLKHLLVAALAVSSLAMAAPFHAAAPVPLPPPPAPRYEVGNRVPPPPPPPAYRAEEDNDRRDARHRDDGDRMDVRRLGQLLREFDEATARRDRRALEEIDRQFSCALDDELREARGERHGQGRQLRAISSDLARLQGRFEPRALRAKRNLYVELMQLAQRDVRGDRRF